MAARPSMRLFLLPISTRRSLIYCEPVALTTAPTASAGRNPSAPPAPKPSYLDRAIAKANTTWADFEKDTKAPLNWKRRLTDYGNVLFRRIPFEEWGLKTIPALPKGHKDAAKETRAVQILYPGAYQALTHRSLTATLHSIAHDRQQLHASRLRWSIIGMPFTAPVAILPVIPNIPFFYLCFRAYSHWTALRGARHLAHLLETGAVKTVPSTTLDALYTAGLLLDGRDDAGRVQPASPAQTTTMIDQLHSQLASPRRKSTSSASTVSTDAASSHSREDAKTEASAQQDVKQTDRLVSTNENVSGEEAEEVMLLRQANGKLIADRLGLPGLQIEVERAVEQVEKSIAKAKEEERQRQQQKAAASESEKK